MSYEWLVNTILNLACQRYGLPAPAVILPANGGQQIVAK